MHHSHYSPQTLVTNSNNTELETNRRKWNQSANISTIPNRDDSSSTARTKLHGPINSQYSEYLSQLQERNRQKKQVEELDARNRELKQREQGFNLCFSGANQNKIPSNNIKSTAQPSMSNSNNITRRKLGDNERSRSNWNYGLKGITLKGDNLALSPKMFEDNSDEEEDDCLVDDLEEEDELTLSKSDMALIRKSLSEYHITKPHSSSSSDIRHSQSFRGSITTNNNKDTPEKESIDESNTIDTTRRLESVYQQEIQEAPLYQEDAVNKDFLEKLVEKLKKLDTRKQEYLLTVLEQLENNSPSGTSSPSNLFEESEVITSKTQQIVFRIHSTWGNDRTVGLTEIEIFSRGGIQFIPTESQVTIKGGLGGTSTVMRLFNGKKKTTNEKHMWQTTLPTLSYLEIVLKIPTSIQITRIVIWNFNKSINESVKGVKELEIINEGETIWKGIIQRGCGNHAFDYSTNIVIEEEDVEKVQQAPIETDIISSQSHEKQLLRDQIKAVNKNDNGSDHSLSKALEAPILTSQKKLYMANRVGAHSSDTTTNQPPSNSPKHVLLDTFKKHRPSSMPIWMTGHENTDADEDVSDNSTSLLPPSRTNSRPESRIQTTSSVIELEEEEQVLLDNITQSESSKPISAGGANLRNTASIRPRPVSQERRSRGSSRASHSLLSPPSQALSTSRGPPIAGLRDIPSERPSSGEGVRDRSHTPRRRPSTMEQSMDSLMHFAIAHSGRLKPREELSIESDDSDSSDDEAIVISEYEPSTNDLSTRSQTSEGKRGNDVSSRGKWQNRGQPIAIPITESNSEDMFEIPIHPTGKILTINCKTSWGDPHYIGLSGIEFFDLNGDHITLSNVKKQVRAEPPDINILPEYSNDPRTIDKLFDGLNVTCDDMHVWLAPYTPGNDHLVHITFDAKVSISMIRFWNYNKSRIHSYRGVRYVEISLDNTMIFKGEIRKAPGTIEGAERFAECIFFTNESSILEKIEKYDVKYSVEEDPLPLEVISERPSTASKHEIETDSFNPELHFKNLNPLERPITSAIPQKSFFQSPASGLSLDKLQLTASRPKANPNAVKCQKIRIDFESSWGDLYYIGLTGIEVLDENMNQISLSASQLHAVPRDMNAISGHYGDYRTLDKLVDGCNITTDDSHMWLIPLSMFDNPHLIIDLLSPVQVSGLRIYNYNKSLEDSFRGCKKIRISIDGKCINSEGHILRKAPGTTSFDFGHTILLSEKETSTNINIRGSSILNGGIQQAILKAKNSGIETPRQDYECVLLPTGYVFKFHLLSTHGDHHYIGLNAIEIYDASNRRIQLTNSNLHAEPTSVANLPESKNDVRTLDKLIDGVNDSWNDRHMWLAPFIPGEINYLYIIFDEPVAVSMIKIWNYSKTPERGVEDMELYVDDVLVYRGELRKAPSVSEGTTSFGQSILFTNDPVIYKREKDNIHLISGTEQMVMFINNNNRYLANQDQQRLYQQERKKISSRNASGVTSRPMTSVQSK